MGYGSHWDMMGGWGGSWLGPLGMIFWLLILAVVIAAAAWFVRSVTGRGERPSHSARRPSALDVLEERYARGEINRDEYLRKRSDVLG